MTAKTPIKRAVLRAVSGSVVNASKAHPGSIDRAAAGSIAKRVAGQLLSQFHIIPKDSSQ